MILQGGTTPSESTTKGSNSGGKAGFGTALNSDQCPGFCTGYVIAAQ